MSKNQIKVRREWIGAADGEWSPTVTLFVVVVAGFGAGIAAFIAGAAPAWLIVPSQAVFGYLAFTVLHEGMHGTAHVRRRLNDAMARVCGLLLMTPLPLFRGVHHAHHGHTNHPTRDPDLFVAGGPAWLRPLRFVGLPLFYRVCFYRQRLWRDRAGRNEAIAMDVAIVAVLAGSVALGVLGPILILWVAPTLLAALWLAFAFDYLPHHPHTHQERYLDTRVVPGRRLNILLLGQNYHLIHHLWNTIPWYRYQEAFEAIEPELRERGCEIGWPGRIETATPAVEVA